MNRTRAIVTVVLALLAVGCGSSPATSGLPTPTPGPPRISAACVALLQPLLDAEEDLNGRLNVGLNKADYGNKVGDISVAYSRIDIDAVAAADPQCILAGAKLEDAFNQYNTANGKWNDCLTSDVCNTEFIKPTLQGYWTTATNDINAARAYFP